VPSSVTTVTSCDRRLASIGLNTASNVDPPMTMSTRLPRATSSWARKYSPATERPSPINRQLVSRFG
jgi:hypothetical protein